MAHEPDMVRFERLTYLRKTSYSNKIRINITQFGQIGSKILNFTQKSIEWANKFISQIRFKNLFTRGILSKIQIFLLEL